MVKKQIDFYKLGQDIALGKKGTGWMAVNELQLEEAKETEGENKEDKYYNYAEGWKETEQWEYEVGQHMTSPVKSVDIRVEEENEWVNGFVEGMMKKEKELQKSKLKKVI